MGKSKGKTLGIIGGMGPLATVNLFEKIVLLTDANSDQEHLHILVDNNTNIPDRTNYILTKTGENPTLELTKSALNLQSIGADFLVMPCNTAHNFYDKIVEAIDIPFLNMIDETGKYIINNYKETKNVGLLGTNGTINAKVYHNIFDKYGLNIVTPSEENQKYIMELIYNIKEGIRQKDLKGYYKAVEEIKDQGVDLFILGCTELSVAKDIYDMDGNYVDPLNVIAISAIEYSGGSVK